MAANGFISPAHQRRVLGWLKFGYSLTGNLLLYGVVFIILVPGLQLQGHARASGQQLAVSESTLQNDSGICKSVDIRNTLDTFKRLEGCRVVEGFVQVLLFDNVNETLLSTISFPELTEITDYLLLYRVNGLRSVGQLFPNLTVIRGENLFLSDYAFVVFEMSRLQEIGLHSLTDITKGSVRIDKNPSLCFIKTIDWNKICRQKGEDHAIYDIKPENECPVCPMTSEKDEDGTIIKACPKAKDAAYNDDNTYDHHLCWNRQHCQKICPENCTSCNDELKCCHESCLGGCANDDVTKCKACRNYSIGFGNERKCLKHCPGGLYKYLGRCITDLECISKKKPLDLTTEIEYPYKIFNKSCILHCPTGYTSDYKNHTCKACEGKCRKECPASNVDSIAMAKTLKGCTVIKGTLEIQIRGGVNVVNQLEENLGMIEDIHGYLKIVRSYPLVSLNFFKSLKRIRGDSLESAKYVFIVLDNQNLQELWDDWSNRTFKIDKGSLFFHFNPKLCLNKIEMFWNKTGLPPFTELEVAKNSNGDKIACNVSNLIVNVTLITSKSVVLVWKPFELEGDDRQLLGYIVYSIEAPFRNMTLYNGRDACGIDKWRVDDVAKNEVKITHPLHKLKPYTQYAFYVKTYTVATERNGAQSEISYFRTFPAMPSAPLNVEAKSNASESLFITWQPPYQPNGNVTHYIVSGKKSNNDNNYNWDRDYCKEDQAEPHTTPVPTPMVPEKPQNNSMCNCTEKPEHKKKGSVVNAAEAELRFKFEDALHNTVYVKRGSSTRRKRQADEEDEEPGSDQTFKDVLRRVRFEREIQTQFFDEDSPHSRRKRDTDMSFPNTTENPNTPVNEIKNVTENGTDIWESFSFSVYGKTEFYITKLRHYTYYEISVQACREATAHDKESLCSQTSLTTKRTMKKAGADNIKSLQISNKTQDSVTLSWEQPKEPNGIIYKYIIEYIRRDAAGTTVLCIPHKEFKDLLVDNTMVYTIRNLSGNFSLRVKARSSAGEGAFSSDITFYIKESTNTGLFVGLFFTIFFFLLGAAVWLYWKKHVKDRDMRLIPTVNPEYVSSKYIPDEWEVPRDKIKLIKELGQGSFGMVYEGEARDIRGKPFMRCAVKTVNEHATNSERMEFLNEASVMKAFDTAHVVRLLGVVSQGQPTLVIMELMANEDLKTYLRSHRPDAENFDPNIRKQPPTLKRIYQMAIEIADGMSYLAAKKFVHRDLAARNCMVAEDLTVKIGDFGMTRDIYETDYYRKGTKGLLPVRWMAPESLRDGVFTSSSDTWSYGVVLWEMATLASQPYQGLANDQVLRYVIDGGVMARPENCPDKLYNLMKLCWRPLHSERPTFLKICSLLLEDASAEFTKVSFYHSAAGIEARSSRPTPSPSQDDQTTPLNEFHDLDSDDDSEHPGMNSSNRISFPTANGFGIPTNGAASTQC